MVGIISNSAALFAQRNLSTASADSQSSIAKLSSGNRIIRASDDVSGLAVGTSLATSVSTLKTVLGTTSQASSLLQIADGGLKNISDILSRQKSLAVSANSDALSDTERAFLQQEFSALQSEIDRIVDSTEFNGVKLLDGSIAASSNRNTSTANLTFVDSGTVGSSVLDGSTFTIGGTANTNLIGSTSDISVSVNFVSATTFSVSIELGGEVYNTVGALVDIAGGTTLTVENEASGATIAFTTGADPAIANQAAANTFAESVRADLDALTIYQNREFASSGTGSITSTSLDGTILEGLSGADFNLQSSTITVNDTGTTATAPSIGAFSVTAETTSTDGQISTTIGGVTYSTEAGAFDGAATTLEGQSIGTSAAAGTIRLYKDGNATTNPNDFFVIDINSNNALVGIDNDTSGKAASLQSALNTAFGSGDAGGLTFQVGSSATDKIDVSLSGASVSTLYVDANGTAVTLDISTAGVADSSNGGDGTGSILASNVIDRAINTVTGLRASVGALSSRFDFAASNISSAIQNTDAARSNFLDADVADESTTFATAQVRLQASISVLAQANQLPQNLLKLIG